ncbi:hypothetical protein [Nostoc favosum]|uniref:Uncharacterized protein n=1 Tax=Nostoc favosum CHAB5714 TaxID=2780399 RepID=A0ABS8IJP7_9NOSO|nr:hypothetical protein [Nostoc favosum]MCC5604487.1 hypothetical protein [Nostoc favosum CHAB5714]
MDSTITGCDVYDGLRLRTSCIRVFFNAVDNWRKRSLSKPLYTKTNKRSRTLASQRWSLPIFPNRGCFGLSILF